jgi:hypothetical protein
MGTVARHNHATDNVKSEGVQKVFLKLLRRKQNLPVSESAKALAKRKETSLVSLRSKLCCSPRSFARFAYTFFSKPKACFCRCHVFHAHSEALASL